MKIDVSRYQSPLSFGNKVARAAWGIVWALLFRPSPRPFFGWRRFILRCFGAQIGKGVHVYPSAKIWAPWNLEMGEHSCLSFSTDCYSVDKIRIGPHATVSQYVHLCSAGHEITDPHMRLTTAPIVIGAGAWVCAGAYVSPGITIGEGAVVAARAVVVKDVAPWDVVGGNPAKFIKKREIAAGEASPQP